VAVRPGRPIVAAARVAIVVVLSAFAPPSVFGQPPGSPPTSRHLFEYWFGPTMVLAGVDGTIATTATVTLTTGAGSGRATQQLSVRTPRHLGVEGGFGIFPLERVGLQVRLDYVSQALSGTSGPYAVTLDYVSASSPGGVPVPHRFTSSDGWPAPTGSSAELTLSFDGAVRWQAGARFSGTIGGGLTCLRVKGNANGLAFGQFTLRNDTTVAMTPYAMSVSYGPVTAFGIDVGGAIAVNVAGPLDVLVDARYFYADRAAPAARVTGLANPAAPGAPSLEDVRASMAPIRASVSPSFARVFVGVRVRS
jgi:hypothetical protein